MATRQISVLVAFGDHDNIVADAKQFKSGSEGYYAGGKITIDGEKYQVSCSIVRVGSKPTLDVIGDPQS